MKKYDVIVYEYTENRHLLTLDDLGRLVGLRPEMLHRYFIFGLIDPERERPELLFEEGTVGRVRKIERLRGDLGLNLAGCGLVLDLLDRIEELEGQIRRFRKRTR